MISHLRISCIAISYANRITICDKVLMADMPVVVNSASDLQLLACP